METPNLSLLPTSAIENRDYVQRGGNDPFTQYAWEDQHDDDHTLWDSQMGKHMLGI